MAANTPRCDRCLGYAADGPRFSALDTDVEVHRRLTFKKASRRFRRACA